ncbi:MAG TPA: formate dehydrogenase subunit gamma [Microvirga sp.]|jgi:formate dehydrogenase subunit gamma
MRNINVRGVLAAAALVAAMGLAPAFAQGTNATSEGPANRGGTTQNAVTGPANAANPTASAVSEEQLFQQLDKLSGRVSIPDGKAAILQQPQGRDYRGFREGILPWVGGIFVLGMILALAAFYFTRGRIKLEHSEESGRKILRFNAFERFTHWMTAMSFIVLAISGLNYIFGKRLLMPIIGPDAFAAWSQYAKYAHNFLSWPFMIGLLFMILVWIKDNIPDRTDVTWIKQGGGLVGQGHPPARRFNAGQKVIFWSVVLGGLALSVSGVIMMFPFSVADINGMQISQYVHATVGVILIAIMIAHIYIGSLGMEGAYDAMGSGEVDLAWARTHHSLWVEEEQAKTASGPQVRTRPAPAE